MENEYKIIDYDCKIDEAMVILQQDTSFGSGVQYYNVKEVCDLLNSKNQTIQRLKDMASEDIRKIKEWEEVYKFTKNIYKDAGVELATIIDGNLYVSEEAQKFTLHSLLNDNHMLKCKVQALENEVKDLKCKLHYIK